MAGLTTAEIASAFLVPEATMAQRISRAKRTMVALNHAVAAAMVHGPETGLELLRDLDDDPRLRRSHRLDAVRGHLQERAGRTAQARAHYLRAAERASNLQERNYLARKAANLLSPRREP